MGAPVSERTGAPVMHKAVHATARCHEHRAVLFPSATRGPRGLATSQVGAGFCVALT